MASTFKIISIVTLGLGVLLLIAAAIVFVKLKIWIVMADLSGKTAQASIERLRDQSGQPTTRKRHHSFVANSSALKRNKGTERLPTDRTEQAGKRFGKRTEPLKKDNETVPLKRDKTSQPVKPGSAGESYGTVTLEEDTGTVPLTDGTAVLEGGTAVLEGGTAILENGTAILENGTVMLENGTTVLNNGGTTVIEQTVEKKIEFKIITDIVLVHTAEKLSLE